MTVVAGISAAGAAAVAHNWAAVVDKSMLVAVAGNMVVDVLFINILYYIYIYTMLLLLLLGGCCCCCGC
jgi:hypothetical protein